MTQKARHTCRGLEVTCDLPITLTPASGSPQVSRTLPSKYLSEVSTSFPSSARSGPSHHLLPPDSCSRLQRPPAHPLTASHATHCPYYASLIMSSPAENSSAGLQGSTITKTKLLERRDFVFFSSLLRCLKQYRATVGAQ